MEQKRNYFFVENVVYMVKDMDFWENIIVLM